MSSLARRLSFNALFRPKPHPTWTQITPDKKKKILILGSGWAGYSFAKIVNRDLYDVTMVSPRNHFLFTPLLASTTTGTLEYRCITEPVRQLKGLKYHQARCMDISPEKNEVIVRDSFNTTSLYPIQYDYLVYAIGARPNDFGIPGVQEHALFLKQVRDAMKIRQKIQEIFETASKPTTSREEKDKMLSFVVVGGGPTSIEFAAEFYDWLTEDGAKMFPELIPSVNITLLEATSNILMGFQQDLAEYTIAKFRQRKIKVMLGAQVVGVDEDHVSLKDGYKIAYGTVVWATGLMQAPLTNKMEFEKSRTGRIVVDEYLKCHDNIFALGDAAETSSIGALPPTAQVAHQQGKYLARSFNYFLSKPYDEFDASVRLYDHTFTYAYKGTMAYIGSWRGVVNLPGSRDQGAGSIKKQFSKVQGIRAWLFWRSAYFTMLHSSINRILVPMYWFKAWIFGRDFSRF